MKCESFKKDETTKIKVPEEFLHPAQVSFYDVNQKVVY